ncbi:f-box domain-containing protein [Diplodia corticola]|uniref:F-box domain-containing protein n=1 Tax=Diplodia corticola TaxID=236234 RepID=A0A1J9SJU8_9PEZI|nr:f-box domain-containing protein [Diplodia corticola]OJD39877.1 f-box domain-containing protein [Diplodia corticola]
MTRNGDPILPVELWANIMRHCPSETLRMLALVSHGCHREARKHLYRSLYFGHGSRHDDETKYSGTRIRNLSAFRRSLSAWPGWRSAVEDARLCWTNNGTAYCWKEPERAETGDETRLNELVRETAALLAGSAVLRNLHLSIPRLDSTVPFGVPDRLTSLDIPVTDCLHNDPDFSALLRLFQIPSLRRVRLLQMLRLTCDVPDRCRQPGTSNVTSLSFSQCGPVSPEIAHLLSWPKQLQVLCFEMDLADGLNSYAYDSGAMSSTKTREALWPVEHSLQDLNIDIADQGGCWVGQALQEDAFQTFAKLRRLSIPLRMLTDFVRLDGLHDPADPPLCTRLPPTIQQLTLKLDFDFCWGDYGTLRPSSEAKRVVAYVAALAEHSRICCPELSEIRISTGLWMDKLPARLECTRGLIKVLAQSGIALSFS